jgi:4-hydroxybenzoate polyprenyltransferase
VRADRPIGIFLLLWPTLWALWIAGEGQPSWFIVAIFVAGTVLMRSAGCAINDFADRNVDRLIARTADRPIVTGEVSAREALGVFAVLSLVAFVLVLFLNRLTILNAMIALALAMIYPFSKRYIQLPQLILGMAFGWAVPMAFAALQNQIPKFAWLLYFIVVIWALIYDTMYAMADRPDDIKAGLKSSAILFGNYDRLIIFSLQLLMLGLLIWVGEFLSRGWLYFLGLGAGAMLFAYQQLLIRHRAPALCFKAFLNNHYVGMAVFAGLALDYLWMR